MRLFIAIDPDEAALAALIEGQRALRARAACRRWSDPGGLHLTLHFLGEVDAAEATRIDAAMAARAAATAPFGLALAGLGAFPSPARARVLWAGVGGDLPALAALQAGLGADLRALGREPEARAFRPHLTLAREPADPTAVAGALAAVALTPVAWEAREVVLYRSHLGPAGARYEVVARHPFGGATSPA